MKATAPVQELPVAAVRGTLAQDHAECMARNALVHSLLALIRRAGYDQVETPILDLVELHERKSGAAVTTRLVELNDLGDQGPVCLRPELTVGVVRSLIETGRIGQGPSRVSVQGAVFRRNDKLDNSLREISQVGGELVGDPCVEADAEVIALAFEALTTSVSSPLTIRIGDVGLILEAFAAAGLPPESCKAVVEALADAAAEGRGLADVESALEHWADWLDDRPQGFAAEVSHSGSAHATAGHETQRLFHQLVGPVVGRRTEADILGRLRQKWRLAESLPETLKKAARFVHDLGSMAGPPAQVLDSLQRHPIGTLAANARSRLARLSECLASRYGISDDRIVFDLGVARGIGFYSGLVFSIHADSVQGAELAGGGRYDGLASVLGMPEGDDYGVGFAIGIDRVRALQAPGTTEVETTYILAPADDTASALAAAVSAVRQVRSCGGRCRLATPADDSQPDTAARIRIEIAADGRPACDDSTALARFLAISRPQS